MGIQKKRISCCSIVLCSMGESFWPLYHTRMLCRPHRHRTPPHWTMLLVIMNDDTAALPVGVVDKLISSIRWCLIDTYLQRNQWASSLLACVWLWWRRGGVSSFYYLEQADGRVDRSIDDRWWLKSMRRLEALFWMVWLCLWRWAGLRALGDWISEVSKSEGQRSNREKMRRIKTPDHRKARKRDDYLARPRSAFHRRPIHEIFS